MADLREQILSRLVTICASVTGIVAVGRNVLDVTGLARPSIIVHDGSESNVDGDAGRTRYRFAEVQRMELNPTVELRLRADTGAEAGSLMSLFRGRIINAVADDATLQALVTTNGQIAFQSFSIPEPAPETKEPRANFEFVFSYPLRRSDLAA
jgi:hypothetical protein